MFLAHSMPCSICLMLQLVLTIIYYVFQMQVCFYISRLAHVQCTNDHEWQSLKWHLQILHHIAPYCTILHHIAPYCTISPDIAPYCTRLNVFGFANHLVESILIVSSSQWNTMDRTSSGGFAPSPGRTTTTCPLRWSIVPCWGERMGTVSQWRCHGEPIWCVLITKLGFLAC